MTPLENFAETVDWSGSSAGTRHEQTHRLFLRAAALGVAQSEAKILARRCIKESDGTIVERDITRQCQRAYDLIRSSNFDRAAVDDTRFARGQAGELTPLPPLSAAFSREMLREKAAKFTGPLTKDYLRSHSSHWPSGWMEFLRGLFGRGSHVFVVKSMHARLPLRLRDQPETISGPQGVWFLCNAVDGKWHDATAPGGKRSRRSAAAVVKFIHLVLECDHTGGGVSEDWLRYLVLLPMPIRAIYTSGGKSVHALVHIDATTKAEWDAIVRPMKRELATCGADPQAMTAVRLTRLPFCRRESTGRMQELLYYRPDASSVPIADLKP